MRTPLSIGILAIMVLVVAFMLLGGKMINAARMSGPYLHVVVDIPASAEFTYQLTPALTDPMAAAQKQAQLVTMLADAKKGLGAAHLSAIVSENQVTVTSLAKSADEANAQDKKVNAAMLAIFGNGHFREADVTKSYKPVDAGLQQNVCRILECRANPNGTRGVRAAAQGTNQVALDIYGVKDPAQMEKMLRVTARMEFRLVPDDINVNLDHATNEVTITRKGVAITEKEAVDASYLVVAGSALKPNCDVTYDNQHNWAVSFAMKDKASSERFGAVTASNIGKQLAIVLDNKIITAPVIQGAIPGDGIIAGGFTLESAKELATLLNAGALPVPVTIVENRVVTK